MIYSYFNDQTENLSHLLKTKVFDRKEQFTEEQQYFSCLIIILERIENQLKVSKDIDFNAQLLIHKELVMNCIDRCTILRIC